MVEGICVFSPTNILKSFFPFSLLLSLVRVRVWYRWLLQARWRRLGSRFILHRRRSSRSRRRRRILMQAPVNLRSTASSESNSSAYINVVEKDYEYYDYESDEEIRNIKQEDVDRYYQQVEESEGFGVDYFEGMAKLHYVTPMPHPWSAKFSNSVIEFAQLAIDHYNKKELQLTNIIKINGQYGSYPTVYLTFEARGGNGGNAKTYQTKLFGIPGEKEQRVEFVRLKLE